MMISFPKLLVVLLLGHQAHWGQWSTATQVTEARPLIGERQEAASDSTEPKSLQFRRSTRAPSTWTPRCNHSEEQLRGLIKAEFLKYLQFVPGNNESFRSGLLKQLQSAFSSPGYLLHRNRFGTEPHSPFRLLNQLLFEQLGNYHFSSLAVSALDSALGLKLSTGAKANMSDCGRARHSRQRAAHLLDFDRLRQTKRPSSTPHVFFLIADDLGWADVGFHSPDVFSPFIDQLYNNGVGLEKYYVDLVCSPSRASFLTGRYPTKTGLLWWLRRQELSALPPQELTLGDMFREAGYGRKKETQTSHVLGAVQECDACVGVLVPLFLASAFGFCSSQL